MSALLNVVEEMILSSCKSPEERANIIRQLYRPTNDDEAPAGFTVQEQRSAMDGFLGQMDAFGQM